MRKKRNRYYVYAKGKLVDSTIDYSHKSVRKKAKKLYGNDVYVSRGIL